MEPPKRRKTLDQTVVSSASGLENPAHGPRGLRLALGLMSLPLLAGIAWFMGAPAPRRPAQVVVSWEGPRLTVRALPAARLELEVLGASGRHSPLVLEDGWLTARLEPEPGPVKLLSRPAGVLDLELPRIGVPAFPDDLLSYEISLPAPATGSWSCQFTADRKDARRVDGVTEGTKVRFPWTPPRAARFVGIATVEGAYLVPGEPTLTVSLQARIDRQLPTLSWLQEDLLEQLEPRSRGAASVLTPDAVRKLLSTVHGLPDGAEPAAWSALEALYRERTADPTGRDPGRLEWLQWTWLLEILARAHVVEPPIHALDLLTPHLTLQVTPIGSAPLRSDFRPVGMYFLEEPDSALSDISFQVAMGAFGKDPIEPDTPDRPAWVLELQQMEAWRGEQEIETFLDGDTAHADPVGIRLVLWHFFRRQPYVLSFETVRTGRTRRLIIGNENDRGHHGNPHHSLPYPSKPGSWKNLPATGSRVEVVVPRSYVGDDLPRKVTVKMLELPDPRRDSKYACILGIEWFAPGGR